jgi:hypothetical protein
LIRSYFRLQLIKTVELNPKQSYIFGLHPHGILPFGGMVNMITETNNISKLLPGVQFRSLAASICFYVPGFSFSLSLSFSISFFLFFFFRLFIINKIKNKK